MNASDSLAEAAFVRARLIDSSFAPPLLHLAEIALRRGDTTAASRMISAFQRAEPDSAVSARLDLMLSCVRAGPSKVDWPRAARRDPGRVLLASRLLSVGGAGAGVRGRASRQCSRVSRPVPVTGGARFSGFKARWSPRGG